MTPDNLILILIAVLFISISVVMKDMLIYYRFVITFVLSALLYFNLRKEEKIFALNYIKTKMKLGRK